MTAGRAAAPPLPDVLEPGLRVVFCGSAAGRESARRGAYYAGPGNRFWPTLAAVGLTPVELRPEQFRELPRHGLGLTDLCKTASGGDAELPAGSDDVAGLIARIDTHRPAYVAFVGKRPARAVYGRRVEPGEQPASPFAASGVFVLPSPSGAARGHWSIEPWRDLARRVTAAPDGV